MASYVLIILNAWRGGKEPPEAILLIKVAGWHWQQVKSNQIKSLLLSHHHSTSALVSEILMSVLQTVQKKQQQQFTYGQTVQKNNNNLHMDSTYLQTVQKTMCKIHIHILSTHSVL